MKKEDDPKWRGFTGRNPSVDPSRPLYDSRKARDVEGGGGGKKGCAVVALAVSAGALAATARWRGVAS